MHITDMQIITGQLEIKEKYPDILFDESKLTKGVPEKLYFPETTDDIAEIVKETYKSGIPIISIAAQTGITGGSTPDDGCIAVSLSHMNRILSVKKTGESECLLTCQPGVTLQEIGEFLENPEEQDVTGAESLEPGFWFYPPDPTELTASLGGTAATNASGARSFFYKPTRNHIHSLTVVLGDGGVFTCTRGEYIFDSGKVLFKTDSGKTVVLKKLNYTNNGIKNASGYYSCSNMDLIDLFIGSEGTLGIFSEITIRLIPKPGIAAGLTFFPDRNSAFNFTKFLRKHENIAALEYFDKTAVEFLYADENNRKFPELPPDKTFAVYWEYIENDNTPFEEIMDIWEEKLENAGTSFEYTWSGFDKKEMEVLKTFRHMIPEFVNNKIAQIKKQYPEIRKFGTDTALPENEFRQIFEKCLGLIEKENLKYVCFGHIGNCHLHINMIPENPEQFNAALNIYKKIMEITVDAGGTVSAEHGIGKLKKEYLKLMYRNGEIEEMKRVKSVLDPKNILNRGNLF
jgi:D-lactate dehydrogenase (cytochrome)